MDPAKTLVTLSVSSSVDLHATSTTMCCFQTLRFSVHYVFPNAPVYFLIFYEPQRSLKCLVFCTRHAGHVAIWDQLLLWRVSRFVYACVLCVKWSYEIILYFQYNYSLERTVRNWVLSSRFVCCTSRFSWHHRYYLTGLQILRNGVISHSRPRITSDGTIHEKSHNSWQIAKY